MKRLATVTVLIVLAASSGSVAAQHHGQRALPAPQNVDWHYHDSTTPDSATERTPQTIEIHLEKFEPGK